MGRAPAKRQRSAFCGKEEAPALKAKVFYRKTEQMRRAPTTGRPYGGRTGHPQITNICLASRTSLGRAPAASEHALFCSLFLKEKHRFFGGSSFIPQKQSFCGNPSAFCGKEEAPAPKAKVFYRKTEQMRRAPTTLRLGEEEDVDCEHQNTLPA